jgi:coatomer protein complex subunit alpha (xenin)
LTRQGECEIFPVDNTDYLFKIALHNKNLEEVKQILSKGQLCGRSIVYYLKEQGYSEIALFFEQDIRQRFDLALSCGNLQVGFETAKELKEKELFIKLAQTALALGNYEIPEKCFQANKELDKLNFFYAVTGSHDKLQKLGGLAQRLDDPMLKYNSSILTANVEDRVKTLMETGQLSLAYLAARSHNLTDMVEYIEQEMQESTAVDAVQVMDETAQLMKKSKALVPLRPISLEPGSNLAQWPMVNLRAREAEKAAQMFARQKVLDESKADEHFFEGAHSTNKEVANILDAAGPQVQEKKTEVKVEIDEAAWGDEDDLGIDDEINAANESNPLDSEAQAQADSNIFVPPSEGANPMIAVLRQHPQNAGLHASAGEFRKAAELLKSQLGVHNFQHLKQHFVDAESLNKMWMQTLPHGAP